MTPELQSPAIRTIKAALPYLDEKYRRNLGIIIKFIEIDALIKNRPKKESSGDMEGMIKAVMRQMYGNEQADKFSRIMNVMRVMKEEGNEK